MVTGCFLPELLETRLALDALDGDIRAGDDALTPLARLSYLYLEFFCALIYFDTKFYLSSIYSFLIVF